MLFSLEDAVRTTQEVFGLPSPLAPGKGFCRHAQLRVDVVTLKCFPRCSRVYWSTTDARKRCVYTCKIMECRPPILEPDINSTVEHDDNRTITHSPRPLSGKFLQAWLGLRLWPLCQACGCLFFLLLSSSKDKSFLLLVSLCYEAGLVIPFGDSSSSTHLEQGKKGGFPGKDHILYFGNGIWSGSWPLFYN